MRNIEPFSASGEKRSFPMEDRFLSDRDMAIIYNVSRATIWRWTRQGHIAAPIKIGGATRWRGSEIMPS
jgi:predicted DNA-binding transcriptional regulator AlpA